MDGYGTIEETLADILASWGDTAPTPDELDDLAAQYERDADEMDDPAYERDLARALRQHATAMRSGG